MDIKADSQDARTAPANKPIPRANMRGFEWGISLEDLVTLARDGQLPLGVGTPNEVTIRLHEPSAVLESLRELLTVEFHEHY